MSELIVPGRYNGPPTSGNGGWTSGELAAHVEQGCPEDRAETWPPVEVSLRTPPPLDTLMAVAEVDGLVVASVEGRPVAEARVAEHSPTPVEPVAPEEARAAEPSYAGFETHPFPTCFSCGPERAEGDGLRIFPGEVSAVGGRRRVAATWTPHPSLAEDWHTYVDDERRAAIGDTWAALDCVGGWSSDLVARPMVLARMTTQVATLPVIGEPHVVVGEHRGEEGRKTFTASTLFDSDGRVVATAEALWVAVDPATFGAA